MCLLRISKHYIINNQGRSQTSEQDEASLERRRREPLGKSGGMPPEKILKSNALVTDPIFSRDYFLNYTFLQKKKIKEKPKSRRGNRFVFASC